MHRISIKSAACKNKLSSSTVNFKHDAIRRKSMSSQLMEVKVPDIGDTKDVPVIEVHVKAGDLVALDQALITLESDKATMDIPSPAAGVVQTVQLKVGERASEGMTVLMLKPNASSAIPTDQPSAASDLALSTNNAASPPTSPPIALSLASATSTAPSAITVAAPATVANYATETPVSATQSLPTSVGHASPSVRKFARELGVDISKVSGSGPKGRVTQNDVQLFVKNAMQGQHEHGNPITRGSSDLNLLPWPKIDFSKFGPIQVQALPRIKKLSAANLARNWVMIPAVTYHEEADITELEAFRLRVNKEQEKSGIKLTALAFLIKICAVALKKFPEFNASLDGDNLVLKQYMHIGFAADTPNGLLVPVIRDVD
ncbi:MAG: 2-oxo acid dehydrogenase subunit E2, partial [Ottowia sp.]|nr:2-oxo acid dehydrogenase subunit E2 [Ottowia sp.]